MNYIRDDIFNWLIIWMMKHCCCNAGVLYTAFERYYPYEIKAMYESWKECKRLE